jgi:menaquinone-dependent protoporphyrinogen IX oxidase
MSEDKMTSAEILKFLEDNFEEVDGYVQTTLKMLDKIEDPMMSNLTACVIGATIHQRFPKLVEWFSERLGEATDE